MTTVQGLTLYHYAGCVWCAMVQRVLVQLGVEISQRDIYGDPRHLRELVESTGGQTVPCLRIVEEGEDRWMHESAEIVAYLNERFALSR
ncbi:MAG: glutaredoxin [Myxococcota bacterium]|nr:glutaredoxin [Myxococcota bacterium]